MEINDIVIGIGGEAGAGIMESGTILAKTAQRSGLFAFITHDYPSLIRGGHNFTTIRIGSSPLTAPRAKLNLLIALNEETIHLHAADLNEGGGIIFDGQISPPNQLKNIIFYNLSLQKIIQDIGGPPIIRNSVAVGGAIALVGGDFVVLESVLSDIFHDKGSEIVKLNLKAARHGFDTLRQNTGQPFGYTIEKQPLNGSPVLLNGNDALSLGALQAGVKFVAIYPMTPITSILEFLSSQADNYQLVVKEPEDEIAAINLAIGAGFAGARSLTATSGGGFCLMTEGLSLSGMAEVPLVIIEGMRGGPSTGLPTQTEQSDLRFVMHAGQGDFPRVVLAPGDPVECWQEIGRAFNLAEKYQLPVIILTDKFLASSSQTVTLPSAVNWPVDRGVIATDSDSGQAGDRYSVSQPVSPRALAGQVNFIQKTNSYEHDPAGLINEAPAIHTQMMAKRQAKLDMLAGELPEPILYGPATAQITIIGWGSTKGPALDAIASLAISGISANYLHLLYLLPFPAFTVATVIDKASNILLVEGNYSGQLAGYIRETTGRRLKYHLRRYDGKPITPEDIITKAKQLPLVSTAQPVLGGQQ